MLKLRVKKLKAMKFMEKMNIEKLLKSNRQAILKRELLAKEFGLSSVG